jgi:chemotaxis protein histidine kinase CheA
MERHLNALRAGADNAYAIAEIFRAVHTMKGTVGFLSAIAPWAVQPTTPAAHSKLGAMKRGGG